MPHNVGSLFDLAAQTARDELNGEGNLAYAPERVSSVQDVATQLTTNGPITGGVIYFGHGAGRPYADGTWGSVLAPGEQAGPNTNVSADNVNLLSNQQLDPGATITLKSCYAGFGSGRYSIAQLIANRLQRKVYAPVAGTYFSINPNAIFANGKVAPPIPTPAQKPIYMIQEGGKPLQCFLPGLECHN